MPYLYCDYCGSQAAAVAAKMGSAEMETVRLCSCTYCIHCIVYIALYIVYICIHCNVCAGSTKNNFGTEMAVYCYDVILVVLSIINKYCLNVKEKENTQR